MARLTDEQIKQIKQALTSSAKDYRFSWEIGKFSHYVHVNIGELLDTISALQAERDSFSAFISNKVNQALFEWTLFHCPDPGRDSQWQPIKTAPRDGTQL